MRRDLVLDVGHDGACEIDFVERYWTNVWDTHGAAVQNTSSISSKPEYRIMAPYLKSMERGATLLDGGCGIGLWTRHFHEQGYKTIGMDISRATINALRERFPENDFRIGDIRATDLDDASVDGYFSWGTFEHFEIGLKPSLEEAYRVLKPGGFLFMTVPFDNLRHAFLGACRKGQMTGEDHRFYQWRFTKGELTEDLKRYGFDVREVKHIHKRQGILRSLHHEFCLPYEWFLTKALSVAFTPVVPGGLIAHMIMAVAQKPIDTTAEASSP